jgi:hypothetical protein
MLGELGRDEIEFVKIFAKVKSINFHSQCTTSFALAVALPTILAISQK